MANENGHQWYRFIDNGCILGLVVSILLLVNQYISKNVELWGVYLGVTVGTLGGVAIYMIWWNSARKGRFILSRHVGMFRFRIWHFGFVFAVGFVIRLILIGLFERYPKINIPNLIITSLIFGFVSFFAIGVLGIYWLQRRYGKRFYLTGQADE